MIKTKGKIKKGKKKNGGAWLIASEDATSAASRSATLIDMVCRVKAVKSRLILTTSQ